MLRSALEERVPKDSLCARVCRVLLEWLDLSFHDFLEDSILTQKLIAFIDDTLMKQKHWEVVANKLKFAINKKVFPDHAKLAKKKEEFLRNAPEPVLPALFSPDNFDFIDIHPLEVFNLFHLQVFNHIKSNKLCVLGRTTTDCVGVSTV